MNKNKPTGFLQILNYVSTLGCVKKQNKSKKIKLTAFPKFLSYVFTMKMFKKTQ